ncbi:MAG: glycogen synthase [Candidatus Riflebacteria bacterium HGW-Riflebacteria-2]|jgi:glycosyltransferase involved in cell wall biosynthesis|nr:MAG: glycogen synthase [Candidatus Riflebacteria bacterium HGW-Riflebacteria-2]
MRILWLTENYPPRRGGMAQACDRIVSNLRSAGTNVDVVSFAGGGQNIKAVQQQNGRLIHAPAGDNPGHTLNCLFNYLNDPASRQKYDCMVAFGGYLPILALPVFKAWLATKAVTLLRGNDFDLGVFMAQRRAMLADALKASDVTCVLSSDLLTKAANLYPDTNIKVIANGIDAANWQADSSDYQAAAAWKQQNAGDGRLVIGVIGQLKEKKGVTFLLENVLRAGLHDRFKFLLIGDVEEQVQQWLDARAEQLCLVQMPFLDRFELLRWYPVCDYIALPSHYDGMPNVLLEAGALGIPVIAARTGGINEVLPDCQRKLTFYPGNSENCREALWQAAELKPEERAKTGKAFRKHISENFTSTVETRRYLELFASL